MPLYIPRKNLLQQDQAAAEADTQPLVDDITQQWQDAQKPPEPSYSLPSLSNLGVSDAPSAVMSAIGSVPRRAMDAASAVTSWALPSLESLGVTSQDQKPAENRALSEPEPFTPAIDETPSTNVPGTDVARGTGPTSGPVTAPAPMPTPSGAATAGGEIDNSSRASFVRTAWPYMLQAAGGNRDAAEMMLAAAISENGSVGGGKPIWANNFFGIKGKGDAGSANAATWEQTPNGPVNINDDFAAYSSPVAGFGAFFDFLRNNSRYAKALANYERTGDAVQLFRDVNAAGYATDPQWASKVQSIRDNQVAPVVRGLDTPPTAGSPPAESPPGAPVASASSRTDAAGVPDTMYRNPLTPTSGPDTYPTDVSAAQQDASAALPPWEASSPPPAGNPPTDAPSVSVSDAASGSGPGSPAPVAGAFQDDYSQSGWVTPGMPPGPPVPDMRGTSNPSPIVSPAPRFNPLAGNEAPAQPSELPQPTQPATKPMLPLYDASMNVVGYVQNQVTPSPEQAQQANAFSAEASGQRPEEMQPGGLPGAIGRTVTNAPQNIANLPAAHQAAVDEAADSIIQEGRATGQAISKGDVLPALGHAVLTGLNVLGSPFTVAGRDIDALLPDFTVQTSIGPVGPGEIITNADILRDAGHLIVNGIKVTPRVVAALRRGLSPERILQAAAGAVDRGVEGLQAGAERASALDAERAAAGQAGAPAYGVFGALPPEAEARPAQNAPTFYSQLARVIDQKMPNRASAQQIEGIIRSGGVKPDEVTWTGLDDFLAQNRGRPITKQEVQDFLSQNAVQVQEVVKGDIPSNDALRSHPDVQAAHQRVRDAMDALDRAREQGDLTGDYQPLRQAQRDAAQARQDADAVVARVDEQMRAESGVSGPPKYGRYTLPGGENYRELLLTLPERLSETLPAGYEVRLNPLRGGAAFEVVGPGAGRYASGATEQEAIQNFQRLHASAGSYRSSHWDEPNILAHVRFNERTAPDGAKVLHIEEIQSDWHQAGRKQGYQSGRSLQDIQRDLNDAYARGDTEAVNRINAEAIQNEKAVPAAPFSKTWPELAMKRMVRWAAENGFDRITWTTGAQQAERFNLARQIDNVKAVRGRAGVSVTATAHDGRNVIDSQLFRPEDYPRLAETVGQDLATKIINQTEPEQVYRGVDLQVGGEGMKGFYDRILPEVANKLGKKFGARVGAGEITTAPYGYSVQPARFGLWNVYDQDMNIVRSLPSEAEARAFAAQQPKGTAVHSLDITPQMRESVMQQGQPLFTQLGATPIPVRTLGERPPSAATEAPYQRPRLAPEDRYVSPQERRSALLQRANVEALNAAGGAFAGNVMGGTGPGSEDQNPEDIARNTILGAAGAVALRHGVPRLNRALAAGAANRAAPEATGVMASLGHVPGETRIPRAGYASDLSQGAEDMVRRASEANAPRETVSRAEVAQKAQDILGVNPEAAQRWQNEALAEPAATRAVRGEALRQAEYIDAEAANAAIERLRAAQQRAQNARDGGLILSEADHAEIADAVLGAAEAVRAFERSAAASTAEGRATARALNQRRNAIMARVAYEAAARARQVGQDAAFAAQEALRASRTGELTPVAEQRLRTLRDKLANPELHGLVDDTLTSRLDETAQGSTTAAAVAGPVASPRLRLRSRSEQAQPVSQGVPMGTRLATDIGNAALGSVVGGAGGYGLPAQSEEERRRHAFQGAILGGVGFPVAGRLLGRGRGVLGTFGPAPTPEEAQRGIGAVTQAFGAAPGERLQFRFRVVPLEDLVTSHTNRLGINPDFPSELQPRIRERVASQAQIDRIMAQFDPGQMLVDTHTIDRGPMIVGSDGVVESGNGRTIALRRLAAENPEKYQRYVDELRGNLGDYGLTPDDLKGIPNPVLVRERISEVDRPAFAGAANAGASARMSPIEEAFQDAQRIPDGLLSRLSVNEGQGINEALLSPANHDLVRAFVGSLPDADQGAVLGHHGDLNAFGLERLKSALLAKTYTGEAGARISTAFVEGTNSEVRNIENAVYASLPSMARAEASIATGARDASLSVADDVATAVDVYARLKRAGMSVPDYLAQASMFGDRETTPFQDQLLQFFNENARSPRRIRAMLEEYTNAVDQGGMFGAAADASKEEVLRDAIGSLGKAPADQGADLGRVGAGSDELARSEPGPAAAPEPSPSAAPIPAAEDSLRRFQAAQQTAEPVAPRTPASEIVPRGGPEGTLAQEGAPEPLGRPGPIPEGMAPAGGPEGRLRAEGAPPEPANLPPVEGVPAGGPEGTLRQQGAPEPLTRPSDVAPLSEGAAPAGGPQGSLQAPPLNTPAEQRALEQSRIRGVVSSIDEVLANPTAPGSLERLQQLHSDLQDISKAGFQRSSDIRARLQRNGLLRAGMASKTEDVTKLVQALANVSPDRPEEMRAVLQIISKPRLIDKLLEYQYVNMLASPITQGFNIMSSVAQIAGRLFLQNPLEYALSGGQSTGVGAAFKGAARGFREGLGEAGQIMRTGVASTDVERAMELGDYGRLNREYLTEQFGPAGAALHMISTRPLAAMDALLGHMAYASAAEQYAQRTADRLLKSGAESVRGMSREQARVHVMSNIWDYPEIIDRAGKIQDYTLLRSKDIEGAGWGRVERALRQMASIRNPAEDAGFSGQAVSFIANNVMPFFNVPLNFAKQGAERTVGVPVNAVRAGRAYMRGDTERGAELAAKATIGGAALTTAAVLALGDNLTGDGPSDPGQRRVWEMTHRPNSFRVPGTSTWISWDGTPFAIPFGMVAGAREGWTEAQDAAAKKGQAGGMSAIGSAALKGAQGAGAGFASQSFIRALGDQYKLITGQDTGLGTFANQAASNVSRFIPAAGMVNFLAGVTDAMERDTGRPLSMADVPEATAARIANRLPGAREQLNPRLDIYGEPTPNERSGVAGVLPYYRGSGVRAGDAITQNLEAAGIGIPYPPSEITFRKMQIPLTMADQRQFQQAMGQAFRRILEQSGAADPNRYPPQALQQMREDARKEAEGAVLQNLGADEIRRRVEGRQAVGAR